MLRLIIVIGAVQAFTGLLSIGLVESLHLDSDEIPDSEPPQTETVDIELLRSQIRADFEKRIAEMWETGEFERDHGGMIPLWVLQRAPGISRSGTLRGPFPPNPLRRKNFDAWCDRIGISTVVPADSLETIWTDYAERMNQILLTQYPPIYDLAYTLGGGPSPQSRGNIALLQDMVALRERARSAVNRTEDRLFRMLSTIEQGLFAADVESWHLYRRWERAQVSTIRISGATIHLSRLLETYDVPWPNRHIRASYEMEIAGAAERDEVHHLNTSVRLAEYQAAGYYDRFDKRYESGSPEWMEALAEYRRNSTPLRRQRWQRQRELYNINLRYITLLKVLLDRVDGERAHDAFTSHALPEYFPNDYDLRRWFDELIEHDAIAESLRRDIQAEREVYVTVQRGIDDSLIQTIHDHQADLIITRTRSPAKEANRQREIDYELQRRYENAVIFANRLVELLKDDEALRWVQEELEELLGIPLTIR